TGRLSGWTAPKDIVLRLASLLTVKGGTGKIVEYVGPGTETVSCTGKGTIANMGAEIGATCSLFPFDERMAAYLEATGRGEVARLARGVAEHLRPDPEVLADPASFYDELVEIDLDALPPQIVGPHTPDLGRPVARLAEDVAKNGWPAAVSAALIGSCTNSSYEDIGRAAHVARAALARGLKARVPFYVTPGSEAVFATCERDGLLEPLREFGAVVLANACGPCIGQWRREDVEPGAANSIVTSFNRNFPKRNDGNAATHAFIASPEVVVAYAAQGRLDADPLVFDPPAAAELPAAGFESRRDAYVAPPADGRNVKVVVDPESSRLQLLEPFAPWNGRDFERLPVLLKARGKCTTDHISPAGPWLKYRGHLDKISDNMFTGATNAFTARPGTAVCLLDHQEAPTPQVARAYKAAGLDWIVVGDENYGEGSSREHAAMSPRHLGCKAVIARSFARIHETNLKKQGILALVFSDPADYDAIGPKDRLSVVGLARFASGRPLTVRAHHPDGGGDEFPARHSYTEEEIGWFRAGSALNALAR
ncbi:aconitate hydratase, partial [bacterium]|nr:aconitate hydratase [bacterium]